MNKFENLFVRRWIPTKCKALVGLVHGLGEHSGRYQFVGSFFNRHDVGMVSLDRIGHGRSPGKRGDAPGWNHLLGEIDYLIQLLKEVDDNLPVFLYGHSMGAHLGLMYAIERKPNINGLIAGSPSIELTYPPSGLLVSVAKMVAPIWPSLLQDNKLKLNYITRDKASYEDYLADPLIHGKVSLRVALNMLRTGKILQTYSGPFPLPLYLMHGTDDGITDPEGSIAFHKRIEGDVTFKLWDAAFHELHQEPEKEDILSGILTWMEERY